MFAVSATSVSSAANSAAVRLMMPDSFSDAPPMRSSASSLRSASFVTPCNAVIVVRKLSSGLASMRAAADKTEAIQRINSCP